MQLTGPQFQALYEAFLDAFDRSSLTILLRLRLDRRLDEIAGPGDLRSVVQDILVEAEKGGWLPQLVQAAHAWLPDHQRLAALASDLGAAAAPRPGPLAPLPIPAIDPDHPPFAAIRRLLATAFTATSLEYFCQTRDAFRPVLNDFVPAQGLDERIDRVLTRCDKHVLWQELLAGVAGENPYRFQQFINELGQPGSL